MWGVLLLVAAVATWGAVRKRGAARARRALRDAGLEVAGDLHQGLRDGWKVEARSGAAPDPRAPIGWATSTRLVVRSDGRWPAEARLRAPWETDEGEPRSMLWPDEARQEEEAATRALFDPATLGAWRTFASRQAELPPRAHASLRAGELRLDVAGRVTDAAVISSLIDSMVRMAERLDRRGRSIPRCLADTCAILPVEEKAAWLSILARRFRGQPESIEACRAALAQGDASCVVAAAPGVRDEARIPLEFVARNAALARTLREAALLEWSRGPAGPDGGAAFAGTILACPEARLRTIVLRAESVRWTAVAVEALAGAAHADDEEAVLRARALARHEDPAAERHLVALLGRGPGVQEAALRGLAERGTLASVPAILPLSKSLLAPASVTAAAREALQRIRARVGPVEAGRLSLGADGGMLAWPELEGGALSPNSDD